MTELEKLDRYLTDHKYPHIKRKLPYFDREGVLITGEFNQIIVYKPSDHLSTNHVFDDKPVGMEVVWDAVCFFGTEGYDEGLLEIMCSDLSLVDKYRRSAQLPIEGYLTADDIIKRLEGYRREAE